MCMIVSYLTYISAGSFLVRLNYGVFLSYRFFSICDKYGQLHATLCQIKN